MSDRMRPRTLHRLGKLESETRRLRSRAQWLERQNERLMSELRLAEQVQLSLLPRALPDLPGVSFGAALRPSMHLAGDFYWVQRLDRDCVGMALGDVMGHGPAAALLSVFAMQCLQPKRIEGNRYEIVDPATVLTDLNEKLLDAKIPGSPFASMIYGVFDLRRRLWTYSGAGHPPALLLRPGHLPVKLSAGGPLLGIFECGFEQARVELAAGDRLALYSDGFDLVRWSDGNAGIHGLGQILVARDGRLPADVVADLMADAKTFEEPSDDLTLLVLECRDD